MTCELAKKECVPCKGGTPPLTHAEINVLAPQLDSDWHVVDDHHLERRFEFDDYAGSVAFTNRVAALAGELDHHPDILLTYGEVTVTIWTHKVNGLTESDFVFAAKVDALGA